MHHNFFQFDFELPNQEESDKLMAMLSEQGFDGFEEEDNSLIAFIPEQKFNQQAFEKVLAKFAVVAYTQSIIENINWNQKWEEEFQPVLVDDFVAIRAHFHQPIKGVEHEIIITPKMSFGTGHHATTHMVIQLMKSVDFTNKSVFDFGTGTGVLAILAEKLGASKVLAIDNDEWSITNTKENIDQNSCKCIVVEQQDTIPQGNIYDVVLANINLNVITANLTGMAGIAKAGTIFLFSGFLQQDETAIKNALKKAGLKPQQNLQRGDWIAIQAVM